MDVSIKIWKEHDHADPKEKNREVIGYVDYVNKEIFIGNDFDLDYYEDTHNLVDTISHEMIHLILAKKVDYYDDWNTDDPYFATNGWDRVSGKILICD